MDGLRNQLESAMIISPSLGSLSASTGSNPHAGWYRLADLGSATYDRIAATGRKELSLEELGEVAKETNEIRTALRNFAEQGVADPLAAAREAVQKTRAREYDTRNAAIEDAFRSVEQMFRISTAADASLHSIAAAESVRAGANDALLASIDHVTARERDYLNLLFGRLNVGAAMLERDFTVTGNVLQPDADGNPRLGTFEIAHVEHGRLLSLDAAGQLTVFDRGGNAMDAAAATGLLLGARGPFGAWATDSRAPVLDRMY